MKKNIFKNKIKKNIAEIKLNSNDTLTESNYKKSLDQKKKLQISLLIICIVSFILYTFLLFKPKIISFDYIDECGIMPGGNSLTHTIVNEDMCNNACYSYCSSMEKKFLKFDFKEEINKCNSCKCYCY